MASLDEIKNIRIEKMKMLQEKGINPFPARTNKEYFLKEVIENFEDLTKKDSVILAGRVMAVRGQGALIFFNINDGTGSIQGLLKKDEMDAEVFDLFVNTVDLGDFVEISGKLFVTKRGEKTLQVSAWKMLTKSLLPLPDKWDGLQDEEGRLRKRYLDVIFNPEVKEMIEKRSKFWAATREFLINKGFMEVETPILENTTGGAEAKPFITHHNALDMEVYLRISPELWLKRLMVAGFPKVFEIGRIFRNEGMDAEHLQDYTQMECYEAYSDYEKGMKFIEEMYKYVAEKTFNTLKFKIKNFDIDLGQKWEIYDYAETIKKVTGIDIFKADLEEVEMKLKTLKVVYERGEAFNLNRAIDNLWKYCRKQIAGPGFLINVPVMMEPLAKRMESNTNLVERFQVILAGSEMGKGFSELNDPIDQASRFAEQAKLREEGDDEAQMTDSDFVEALEHGMPPTFGFGFAERLFSFLMDKPIRECQIFPLLKPKKD
jgi:lysyl-tRNA synthetase class 2